MIKKFAVVFLAALLVFSPVFSVKGEETAGSVCPELPFGVDAKGAVVIEAESGRVLFEQNAHDRRAMASTTKIMTSLLALEQPDRDEYFTVDNKAVHVEGSSMGLKEDDKVSFNTLAYGMLLPSGNDAANVTAVKIAGSQEKFAEMMNERAVLIGMENSNFVTPSGLDAEGHYSTAYDMALLAREALGNEDFRKIVSSPTARVEYGNPPYARTLKNHNKLLNMYEYAIGVKTGFTSDAGRCLVTAAEKDGMTLITVTLGASDDFNTHRRLYEFFYDNYEMTDLSDIIGSSEIPLVAGNSGGVLALPIGSTRAPLCEGELENITKIVSSAKFLYAPVQKGDIIGTVKLYSGDNTVLESPLVASEKYARSARNKSFLQWLFRRD